MQVHLAVNGHVDPAYINEVLGMDRLTASYFNIDTLAAKPDMKATLADTATVSRTDRRFAQFLTEIAASNKLDDISFGNVKVDSDAFAAIMIATKPDLPAAAQFARLAALAKQTIADAQREFNGEATGTSADADNIANDLGADTPAKEEKPAAAPKGGRKKGPQPS